MRILCLSLFSAYLVVAVSSNHTRYNEHQMSETSDSIDSKTNEEQYHHGTHYEVPTASNATDTSNYDATHSEAPITPNAIHTPISEASTNDQTRQERARWPTIARQNPYCSQKTTNYDCQIHLILKLNQPMEFGYQHPESKITFFNSELEYLPKSLFDAFPEMDLANLDNLKISIIENGAFSNANKLQTLFLRNNRLKQLFKHTFQGAQSLKTLVLGFNELQHIDREAFYEMLLLQHVYLRENKLQELPYSSHNDRLEIFDASYNILKYIADDQFTHNYAIKKIYVKNNDIDQFDLRQLDNKDNLEEVDVSSNILETLYVPKVIRKLIARNNSINSVQIAEWTNIEELDLSNNALRFVPQLKSAQDLRILDLSYNELETLQLEMFSSLKKLEHLNISNNNLFELKMSRSQLNFKVLDLSNNKLSIASFKNLDNLESLYLQDNNLVVAEFASFKRLKEASLSKNDWDCKKLVTLSFQTRIIDRDNQYKCRNAARLNNKNICCADFNRPYNDVLNEILTNIHHSEFSNTERLKQSCRHLQAATNFEQQIRNEINQKAQTADRATRQHNEAKSQIQQQINEIGERNIAIELHHAGVNATLRVLNLEIEKQRNRYNVIKEGLLDPQNRLEQIIGFVKERNAFKAALIETRETHTKEAEDDFGYLTNQKSEKEKAINKLKEEIKNIKSEWKAKKTQRDSMEKKYNKNAASIHGRTGKVTK